MSTNEPTVKSVADALDKIATAFDEYKSVNDARIAAAAKGAGTAELDAKLAKMDGEIDRLNELKADLDDYFKRFSAYNRAENSATDADRGSWKHCDITVD